MALKRQCCCGGRPQVSKALRGWGLALHPDHALNHVRYTERLGACWAELIFPENVRPFLGSV